MQNIITLKKQFLKKCYFGQLVYHNPRIMTFSHKQCQVTFESLCRHERKGLKKAKGTICLKATIDAREWQIQNTEKSLKTFGFLIPCHDDLTSYIRRVNKGLWV